jgi:hypothetical protein
LAALLAVPLVACTWLVGFDTLPCDGGICLDGSNVDSGSLIADGPRADSGRAADTTTPDVVGVPDVIAQDTFSPSDTSTVPDVVTMVDSAVMDVVTPPDTSTPVDTSIPNPCAGKPDGYSLSGLDTNARCCAGLAVETTSDSNCGVCGITCNTGLGQSCGLIDGHYLCLNCAADGDCWSGCCAGTVSPLHCAADDCSTGACSATADPCAPYGATCTIVGVGYCAYP